MPGITSMVDQGIAPPPAASFMSNVPYIPPGLEGLWKQPFWYNIIFASIAAGANQTGTATINNDSYFIVTELTVDVWDAATGNTTGTLPQNCPMLVKILDSSNGQYMMDQATPLANIFGTGQQKNVSLFRGKTFFPGGQIQLELTNGMATTQRVRFTFGGFKVYNVPDQLR